MTEVKRYEMVHITQNWEDDHELRESPEGEYIKFSDHKAALEAKEEEIAAKLQRLAMFEQSVERGAEEYIDAEGLISAFIAEQENLNGRLAKCLKALEKLVAQITEAGCPCEGNDDQAGHSPDCAYADALRLADAKKEQEQ